MGEFPTKHRLAGGTNSQDPVRRLKAKTRIISEQADATYVRKHTPADDAERHFKIANQAAHGGKMGEKTPLYGRGGSAKDHLRGHESGYLFAATQEEKDRVVKKYAQESKSAKKAVEARKHFKKDERNSP